jgi:hypothetical protein
LWGHFYEYVENSVPGNIEGLCDEEQEPYPLDQKEGRQNTQGVGSSCCD